MSKKLVHRFAEPESLCGANLPKDKIAVAYDETLGDGTVKRHSANSLTTCPKCRREIERQAIRG